MNPDYQIDRIRMFNCDNMDFLRDVKDGHYDIGIIDPPYGIGADNPSIKNSKAKQKDGTYLNIEQKKYNKKDWDSKPPSKEYFNELFRVTKQQIIFGANYFGFVDLSGGRIVWDKLNGKSDQYGCEIAYCSFNIRTDIVYYLWSGFMQGEVASNDINLAMRQIGNKKLNEKRYHQTQKPVKLYKWILSKYAKTGDKILDTHAGVFGLACACLDMPYMGYSLDACEIEKEYFDIGVDKVKKVDQIQLNI